jgi:acyl-CoA reductase-like NAD-dependent aldehyde dehydrogenase
MTTFTEPARMLIDGEWVPARSGKCFDVRDPGTGEVITQVAEAAAEDVDDAVRVARAAFDEGRWTRLSPQQRSVVLWRTADIVESRIEELADLESLNLGNPIPQARGMIGEVVNLFRYYAGLADKVHGRTVDVGPAERRFQGYTLKEPVGAVGMIVPWNAPLIAATFKIAPALAAGCSFVIKPSEETPLSTLQLVAILHEAGVPAGVSNVVTGFGDPVGAAIASHPDLDLVGFTGSPEVGRLVVHGAEGSLKKVQLELGGKSPQIVFPDADLEAAVQGVATGIFWNSGQICTAGTRLYAHESIFDELVEGVAGVGRSLRVGYRTDPDVDLGPLISQKQLERVQGYVDSGVAEGGRVVAGGRRIGDRGYFFEPTVVADVDNSTKMIREEIFGPVIGAMSFTDIDEAVALANNTNYGLAASVWTRDVGCAHAVAKKMRAGRVGINVHRAGGAQMTVGGYRQSGWGQESGMEGLDTYLQTKSVITLIDR